MIAIRRRKLPDPSVIGNAGSFFKNPVVSKEIHTELFKKYEIPANKVIFTISSVDIEELHNKICLENNITDKMKVIYWGWSLRMKSLEMQGLAAETWAEIQI